MTSQTIPGLSDERDQRINIPLDEDDDEAVDVMNDADTDADNSGRSWRSPGSRMRPMSGNCKEHLWEQPEIQRKADCLIFLVAGRMGPIRPPIVDSHEERVRRLGLRDSTVCSPDMSYAVEHVNERP